MMEKTFVTSVILYECVCARPMNKNLLNVN